MDRFTEGASELRNAIKDSSDALADKSVLGQVLILLGVLFALFAVLFALVPSYALPSLHIDSTPMALASVGLLLVGGILRSDFVGSAERATRRGVNTGESQGGVYIAGNVSDLYITYPEGYNPAQEVLAQQLARSAEGLRRQEAILREIYTLGLVQARLSFNLSMSFAGIGAILLFCGVGLAVFRAPTDGAQYASVVAALSGTVVTLTSALFFAQANSTRKNMTTQAVQLREESQDDRRITTVRELVVAVTEEKSRNELHAEIARSLINNLARRTEPGSPEAAPARG
ncbi:MULTISPECIES: hypothetical protein [unclassified Actinoplanes]|uniref:TRADD-N-associated membrane domain-containing protein n=1 Tax=unclassified Actinoplanes TaxID=2626549 RepID=UPI0009AF8A67|nr:MULTISPECIES: hypothetical protein [unclassified Actinoplanes]